MKWLVTLKTGSVEETQSFRTKTEAKKALTTAMSDWRRGGQLPFNGVYVIRRGSLPRGYTATWNVDYTAATFKYGSSKYVAGTMLLAPLPA